MAGHGVEVASRSSDDRPAHLRLELVRRNAPLADDRRVAGSIEFVAAPDTEQELRLRVRVVDGEEAREESTVLSRSKLTEALVDDLCLRMVSEVLGAP